MTGQVKYMLDTNIFSNLAKRKIGTTDLPSDGQLCATAVQLCELENTPEISRRQQLVSLFQKLVLSQKANLPCAFSFGIEGAGFGQGEWRNSAASWHAIKNDLDEQWERRSNKKKRLSRKENNIRDAAIAEAALHNSCVLITADRDLASVVRRHGIKVVFLKCAEPV
jgi:predicted nucleic acid-binding protein